MRSLAAVLLAIAGGILMMPPNGHAADAPDGAAIYKSKCAMCHGPDGKGQTAVGKSLKVKDLGSAEVQKQSDEALEKVIENGKGNMPGYKSSLSEAEIDAVVKFLRAFAAKK